MTIIDNSIINFLQTRIKHEEENSKAYSAMSSWLNLHGYIGASKLWKDYSEEELIHKSWAVKYLLDLNILPIEPSQEKPQTEFKGLPQIVALSYQRELRTTEEVKFLSEECLRLKDMLAFTLSQKYVEEQINEIAKIQQHVDFLESFGVESSTLVLLDNRMGTL